MAPVWEANNVWLIFALVVLWTAFPRAFAAIMSTLYLPLALAAAGIVLRGSGFVFREATRALTGRRLFGAAFALSSVVTPFFLGAVFGAIASGRVRAGDMVVDPMARISGWCGPTSILVGVLAVSSAAFLSAVFLVFDARRVDETLDRSFRWRAVGSGLATGLIAIVGLFVIRSDAPFLFHGLVREGLPFVLISGACGGAVVVLLTQGITRGTRALAVVAVVSVLAGWGVAQYPYLLPTSLTLEAAAGAPRSLGWLVVMFLIACVTAVPALALLFVLDQRSKLQHGSAVEGEKPESRHRVVVVGGGFGGLFATRALGWSPVDVTLVDREPHHLFQPLLYQVATGILSEGEIAPSLRHILRFQENAAVLLAEVTGFDLERREVAGPTPRRRGDRAPLRQPDRLGGRRHVLLRPRRAGRARARDEDARRRAPVAAAPAAGAGDGGAQRRSRQAAGVADGGHRRRRRRPASRSPARSARWPCAPSAPASDGSIPRRFASCCSTPVTSR